LLVTLGEAQRRAGDPAHRETLLAASRLAQERGDASALARAALANTRGNLFSSVGVVDTERVAALEAALEAEGEDDGQTQARLLAYLSQELVFTGDDQHCLRLSDESLAIARRLGDDPALADVLIARYHAIATPSTLAERVGNTVELLAVAERLGDPLVMSRALWLRYRAVLESGDVEEARRYHARSERLSAELGQPFLRWFDAWNRDGLVLLAGQVEEAERLVQTAFELGEEIGQPDNQLFGTIQHCQVRFEQGRLGEAEERVAGLVAQTPQFPLLRAIQALLYCELDRIDEARSVFEELAREDFSGIPLDVYWLRAVTDAAAVCAYLGDAPRAAVLFDLLAPYAEQLVVAIRLVTGTVDHYLGMLASTVGRFNEAETRFAAAEATHARIGAPTWLARTRLEWARMLTARRQAGDRERAHELVSRALGTARELGLANVERRAARLVNQLA
jgi:tetratricopeptide (TPR) repeat protein